MVWDDLNRRKSIRVDYPFTIHIYIPEEPPISAYTENVNESGVGVTIMREVEVNSIVKLEIHTRQRLVECYGRIGWMKKRESKYVEGRFFFDVGIEFRDIKKEDRELIKDCIDRIVEEKQL